MAMRKAAYSMRRGFNAAALVVSSALVIGSNPAFADAKGSVLGPSQQLSGQTSDYLASPSGYLRLYMQNDCNLVLYSGGTPTWQTHTDQNGPLCTAIMQTDGNLVVYKNLSMVGGNAVGQVMWASYTQGNNGAFLLLQDDGNLVIYSQGTPTTTPSSSNSIWSTETKFNTGGQSSACISAVYNFCVGTYDSSTKTLYRIGACGPAQAEADIKAQLPDGGKNFVIFPSITGGC